MKTGITQVSVDASTLDLGAEGGVGAEFNAGGWRDIVSRVTGYVSSQKASSPNGKQSLNDLSGLLRLQLDITQYQLRVEVFSKVAESAVASLRKLQQPQ